MTPGEEDLADKLADLSVTRGTQPELDEAHDTAASAAPTQGAGSPRAADEAGSERPAGVGSDSRKLFVGGLPQLATEELVLSVFESYGTVEEVRTCHRVPTRCARARALRRD
jgi:RNA recognition motif-containing protein